MRSLKTFNQGLMLVDVARPGWEVLHVNEAWSMHAGGIPLVQELRSRDCP